MAFGANDVVFVKKKQQTKHNNKYDFQALNVVKTFYQRFTHIIIHIAMTCGTYFWRKALDSKFPTYLSLYCL